MMAGGIGGTAAVEITSADIDKLLTDINRLGVRLQRVTYEDSLTVNLILDRRDIKAVRAYIRKKGGSIKIVKTSGLYWLLKGLLKRPLLIGGIVIIFALSLWIPTRVFFISVEGNEQIPTRRIIEYANQCGISFGASRREVRSEKMKNSLLAAIPTLQWAGINTSGCTAVISVKERTETESEAQKVTVSSIVAARDGVIESCTTRRGNQLCKIGQAVKKGDILISGYTDCGLKVTATKAEGEVFAQTRHTLTAVAPLKYSIKGEIARIEKRYGILFGKKRINFYKDSGILGSGCDKIYKEYYLELPGGFRLPVALFVTSITAYDLTVTDAVSEFTESRARSYAREYLLTQLISGEVLRDVTYAQYLTDVCVLRSEYICSEMIGRVQNEETIGYYGEDHGKNR